MKNFQFQLFLTFFHDLLYLLTFLIKYLNQSRIHNHYQYPLILVKLLCYYYYSEIIELIIIMFKNLN